MSTSSLPTKTDVLIVGAGPIGTTVAITLLRNGAKDITIVDGSPEPSKIGSRAVVVHSRTLEVLKPMGITDTLLDRGIVSRAFTINTPTSTLIPGNFGSLESRPDVAFPHALLISQCETEGYLNKKLEELGKKAFRPLKLVGLVEASDGSGLEALFESGEKIQAKYVIGADGSHSNVRTLAQIGFHQPDHPEVDDISNKIDPNTPPLIVCDVYLANPLPPSLSRTDIAIFFGIDGAVIIIPLPCDPNDSTKRPIYRIIAMVPQTRGEAPKNADAAFIQSCVDRNTRFGPDKSAEHAIVESVVWTSRFRTRHGVADRFYKPFGKGGVFLMGDAAHIHSPAGGQGMNLGIREAVAVGEMLAPFVTEGKPKDEKLFEEQAVKRRKIAIDVINMTNGIVAAGSLQGSFVRALRDWVMWFAGRISYFRSFAGFRLSGYYTG
ncbi:FAD/NAD(P)-binding domain-containing protein [Sistotremastrum niveocremeum HHB9708]|uniref:FAD/NAD(P)-binding domain-containing protein n=1 Tax=Sistotremastrum niveocremeum HHB9708 TaxID=1314777 RepID=A0A164X0I8_9AGAM|nr:FAD/NAD(P)-binding domain-containing protein [Sistotremastrum niveocremeum HHB9708]